jgi:hypothetical protein
MAKKNDPNYNDALKAVNELISKYEKMGKSAKAIADSWNTISSQVFKISGSDWVKSQEKTTEEIKAQAEALKEMNDNIKSLGTSFGEALNQDTKIQILSAKIKQGMSSAFDESSSVLTKNLSAIQSQFQNVNLDAEKLKKVLTDGKIEGMNDEQLKQLKQMKEFKEFEAKHQEDFKKKQEKLNTLIEDLKDKHSELRLLSEAELNDLVEKIGSNEDLSKVVGKLNDKQREALSLIGEDVEGLRQMNKALREATGHASDLQKELSETHKNVFSISKGVQAIGKNIASDMIGRMMEFDKVVHDVQKQTGVIMDTVENQVAFSHLTTEVAQFGMSVEGAGQMVKSMADELKTTDFGVLTQATKDFAAIEGATGAASEHITTIAGELMRMGESSEQVKDYMEGADQEARKFGVSSKKVIEGISRNIKKVREMGFVGGEKSLAKMVATAERLRMNIDETFDMAKRGRTIEGAMEMAADLQLAGGSFANINPMDLLAASRKGPAELQKILGQMGKDIGHFSKETGKFEFDPVDVDRLQMVSEATGQSMESLQNMIQKQAEDNEKLNLFPDSMFDNAVAGLEGVDKDLAKSQLADMLERNKDGTISIKEGSLLDQAGIKNMKDLNDSTLKQVLEKKAAEEKTLEEQNKRNQDLTQSFNNFINSLMSLLTVFQPVLEFLGEIFQSLSSAIGSLGPTGKTIVAGLMVGMVLFSTSVGAFIKDGVMKMLGGFKDFGSKILSGGKGLLGKISKAGGGEAGGVMGQATQAAQESDKVKPGAGSGLKGFVTALKDMSKEASQIDLKGIGKFALSLTMLMAPIGLMALLFSSVNPMLLLAFGATLIELAIAMLVMSKITGSISIGDVMKGALALMIMGAALIPFALVAQIFTGVDWMSVLAGIGIIALVVLGLMGLGALMMGPQFLFLLIGVGVLTMVGAALLVAAGGLLLAATAFQKLGEIDWSKFMDMGTALSAVVPGMLAFSLASLMFANPFTILSMLLMIGILSGLALVMVPLAAAMSTAGESMNKFADGIERLAAATDKLSTDKLEELKAIGEAFSNIGAGGGALGAIAGMLEKMSGEGGGGGGTSSPKQIEINLKLNGRDVQKIIVDDTKIVT